MTRALQCPRCGDATMEVSYEPCTTSGNWVVYRCVHEHCCYGYRVYHPAVAYHGARPSLPIRSHRARFSRRTPRLVEHRGRHVSES